MNQSPERRAEVIEAIRALAQFFEDNPQFPVPNGGALQFSITDDLTDAHRDEVRGLAESIGVDLDHDTPDRLSLRHDVGSGYTPDEGSWAVTYVIFGSRPVDADSTEAGDAR